MSILGRLIAAGLATALAAATASSCHGGSCHTDGDCHGQTCVGPNPGPSCGISPKRECTTTSDCGAGEVCSSVIDPCSNSGFGSVCMAPCTGDAACGAELRCNAGGACEPIPCGQGGITCPTFLRCVPPVTSGPVWSFDNGCQSISCLLDGDCPAFGSCVNGACQSGPGHCETQMVVP